MPANVTATSSSKPTTVYSPDTRYATAPLSYAYRDYSVNGEEMQDKATGEVFIRRPADGKVVSYFQNKRYLYEQVNELNIVLGSNTDFAYSRTNGSGMYSFVDYDITTITEEFRKNIIENTSLVFVEGDERYGIAFKLSVDSNKFIARATTRDSDKAGVEYLSSLYDTKLQNYSGSNITLQEEAQMYVTQPDWYYNNAILTFRVVAVKNGEEVYNNIYESGVRLNEASCVDIDKETLDTEVPDGYDYIKITFEELVYRKIKFVMEHLDLFGDPTEIQNTLDSMLYPGDKSIYVHNLGVGVFTDDILDVNTNPVNGTLICLMDTVFVSRYISKLRSATNGGAVLLRTTEPADDEWYVGSIWAEFCREVNKDGVTIVNPTETTMEELERYYSKDSRIFLSLTLDASEASNIYVEVLE